MKKLLIITALLTLLAAPVWGETWYKANQATVAWDAVTLLEDGTPVPATDVVRYRVWTRHKATGTETQVGDVLETQQTITFEGEGFWWVGVQAARYVSVDGLIPEGETPELSTISWSLDAAVCQDGVTFGIRHHVPPGQVKGLRAVQ